MTLVVLAAGMGSRFGGVKQLTPLTDNGEFVIDFTVFDAIRAGFDRVIFIIREEHREAFEETIGSRIRKSGIKVGYAYQKPDLPDGFVYPAERQKPWGTGHAVMSLNEIDDNFGVVNADDFYGAETFRHLADFLRTAKKGEYCSVGYRLDGTLSENGAVSRGICYAENGYLKNIEEKTKLSRDGDHAVNTEPDGTVTQFPLDSIVSMTCFGFTPDFVQAIKKLFVDFLRENEGDLLKKEFYLPSAVQKLIDNGTCSVKLLSTASKWMGVTYRSDSEAFTAFIKDQRAAGNYPANLW